MKEAAEKLDVSVRTVQRLVKKWEQDGLVGLTQTNRADKGKHRSEWGTYGKPEHFYTDGGKDFRSNHLSQIGAQLGFVCHLRDRPSEGGVVERPFKTLNDQLFLTLPGYTGSNVQERPEDAEKDARLTLRELEQLLVRYIVDRYNQSIDARIKDQTRFERWEAGLPTVLGVIHKNKCFSPCVEIIRGCPWLAHFDVVLFISWQYASTNTRTRFGYLFNEAVKTYCACEVAACSFRI